MCGALRAGTSYTIPTKNHLGENALRTVASESPFSRSSSVLALVMRAGRGVGGGNSGGSLLTANVRSVLGMRQWRGVSSGPCGGTLFTVDVLSVLSMRQKRGVGCGPSVGSKSPLDTKARSKSAQLGSGGMRQGRGAWTKGVGAEMKCVGAEGHRGRRA
jgi:hypothetical protein